MKLVALGLISGLAVGAAIAGTVGYQRGREAGIADGRTQATAEMMRICVEKMRALRPSQ